MPTPPPLGIICITFLVIFIFIALNAWRDVLLFLCMQLFGRVNLFLPPARNQFILAELEKNNYYQNLSAKGKLFFYHRVLVFMMSKRFFGDGLTMSDEMKVDIASCAVQLTFRIRGFYIDHIQLIRVFPHSIWSRMVQHQVKGLTTGGGVMWLSWPDIKKGFELPEDGINLGLHEMAHAFMLTVKCESYSTRRICRRMRAWRLASQAEFLSLKAGNDSLFRKYGGTNGDEFFAVSVECFYEQPHEFARQFPEIYKAMCRIFNQDPLNTEGDYKLG